MDFGPGVILLSGLINYGPMSMAYDRDTVLPTLDGMNTKADKIRALARFGCLDTEIAHILGISPSHARRVIERSKIGLDRTRNIVPNRETIEIDVLHDGRGGFISSGYLISSGGFRRIGEWRFSTGMEGVELSDPAPKEPGVYAFVVDQIICYVGVALTTLHKRMGHYRRGSEGMRTSRRVKGLILDALRSGSTVEVFVAIPEPAEWHSMPVSMAAGLEVGLITHLLPAWNKRSARRRLPRP